MRKLVWLCGALLALAVPAMAQDDLPRIDLFGGYSYIHFSINGGSAGNITSNLNGGTAAVAFYPTQHIGLVGDFGGYKISTLSQGGASIGVSGTTLTYLFGPRLRLGSGPITPFVQVLFGGAHNGDITTSNATVCGTATPPCTVSKAENSFAMTAGGGVDLKIARHFALRGQAEYLMTRFKQGMGTTGTQSNARISAGIVIR